jgi:DNA-binding SARP family transcriptional activator
MAHSAVLTVCTVLHVRCLGTFALRADGEWCTREALGRGREFLQYLVSYPHAQASRETLAEALWPDQDGDRVAHRLHLAVSGARAALRSLLPGIDAIRRTAHSYAWDASMAIESDVERLLSASRSGSRDTMESAAALYAGEFLAGDSAEWMYPLRVRCTSAYVRILEQLAEAAIAERDYHTALEWSLRLAESDRSHEGAARLVMRTLAACGRRGAALAQFDELLRYLRSHLAIEPSAQTLALREEIARGIR